MTQAQIPPVAITDVVLALFTWLGGGGFPACHPAGPWLCTHSIDNSWSDGCADTKPSSLMTDSRSDWWPCWPQRKLNTPDLRLGGCCRIECHFYATASSSSCSFTESTHPSVLVRASCYSRRVGRRKDVPGQFALVNLPANTRSIPITTEIKPVSRFLWRGTIHWQFRQDPITPNSI